MKIIVLGSAAGGGFPQWNCRCPVCRLAWAGDPRVVSRTQSGLAVSADGEQWILLNASPDLRQQILATPALQPKGADRGSPIKAVILTNAELDHVAGLLTLRERQPFRLLATAPTHAALDSNPLFQSLDRELVERALLRPDEPLDLMGLRFLPFIVPGKVPLYQEGAEVEIGLETEQVMGLEIRVGSRCCLFVPNCARITPALCDRLSGADLILFDGTTYQDDEMIRLGLSSKTARRMGHVAMDGADGSLARLAHVPSARRVYLHLNNSNPVLVDGSEERTRIEAFGWELGYDGMELAL
ncbi:MAG TPA: pyrroloquinoline quinone biosynthesis protein PqqB [Geminicoccus sp.]|uniref:pyrroloquinoline quinone biosynthesis protein PqqB n=1 Tax=Geminicoccus sp. TaxID=2024832 RepID=UPI002E3563C9|nr:pyrroloquinoline quinone biosynthesis protein PqqB [Geminicoccus sp.]HEX2528805.1 pyrroloquinoline quinone biosynthesis protein PqqB [Geminicoccus sp.]